MTANQITRIIALTKPIDMETAELTKTQLTEDARECFKMNGLTYSIINRPAIHKLIDLINEELVIQETRHKMTLCRILKKDFMYNSDGLIMFGYLKVKSSYYDKREAISFNDNGFIGFAGWADKGNVKPFLNAFHKWIDLLSTPITLT